MTRDTLQFVHSTRPPADDVRVFASLTRRLLGAEFTFRVVGSSHYVSAPAYDFHELSSCEPVGGVDATTLRLDGETTADSPAPAVETGDSGATTGARRRLDYANDGLRCATVVERRPLAAFPADANFDLAYWFGEDAATTVAVGSDGYETYHTYPEFDLALYTRTVFESVPDAAAAGEPPERSGDRATDPPGQPTD